MMSGNPEGAGLNPAYPLGHSDRELERLSAQARLVGPFTRRIFRKAGIGPGMRVLDVGSGNGEVAFLAAELVGAEGLVVGTDKAPGPIAAAQARAQASSVRNVDFRVGDPGEMSFEQPFDAVVGRYVLQFNPDPAAMLRKLASHVRPGGVIAFHELDWDGVRSCPPSPTYDCCCRWFVEIFRLLGTETRMGVKMHAAFVAAGLPVPSMSLEAIIGGADAASAWLEALAELIGVMLPEMERLGVTTPGEVGMDTLAGRLVSEVAVGGGVVVGRSEVGAWSYVQAAQLKLRSQSTTDAS
jgi:2-polyprenyl-3-methyl-5-hydroxy-6-metoxy-1,4-benzoquinol methylase